MGTTQKVKRSKERNTYFKNTENAANKILSLFCKSCYEREAALKHDKHWEPSTFMDKETECVQSMNS